MNENQTSDDTLKQQKNLQQQSLGNVQVDGDSNLFNAIQANIVTLTQNKIIQISANEIKTRKFIQISPYKGLKSFKLKDKDQFFGRDQFIAGLIDELEQTNFVLLLGASGSGKSSVVRAGLIPWLAGKWGTQWFNLTLTPDHDPFDSLYSSLRNHFKQSEIQFVRTATAQSLGQLVKRLKQPDSFWFIFIDQLEELFTISESEKRDRFITSLVALCRQYESDPTIKIVGTMRADFLNRLDTNPANLLADVTKGHRPLITQMHPDELRLAIEQPAAHHGVVFEPGLVKTIIKDVQGQAGYLSLLQYTLDILWKEEIQETGLHDRTLSFKSYYRIGGVRGALQRRMDQIYQGLSPLEQLATQRIFLKLVGIGGDTASETAWKPVRKREVRSQFSNPEEQRVLAKFIDANLLISDTTVANKEVAKTLLGKELGATVEITHEILLTAWDPLKEWIKENRQAIALRNRLNDDVIQWKITNSDDELWAGRKLEKAINLGKSQAFNQVLGGFSPEARAFLNASAGLRNRPKQPKQIQQQRQQTKTMKPADENDKTPQKNTHWGKLIGAVIATVGVVAVVPLINRPNLEVSNISETESPNTSETESPNISETESPNISETESPNISETGSPNISETGSPNIFETESPNISETGSPNIFETESRNIEAEADAERREIAEAKAEADAERREIAEAKAEADAERREIAEAKAEADAERREIAEAKVRAEAEADAERQLPLTIRHTRQGASSSHTDSIVAYKTWGGSKWIASIDSTGLFTHTRENAASGHTDTIISYITWDGSEWTATIDPGSKVFTHTRRGATSSHTDTILNYLTWDGSAWTMRLE